MTVSSPISLHEHRLSLNHAGFVHLLASVENLLIIQDLDGVCMGLVKDPLTRVIDPHYVMATQAFDGHFYVLTNGEHIGQRGVNGIIERAFDEGDRPRNDGLYLPGLAAGGVQWQDRHGDVSHPGVSDAELAFLKQVPQRIQARLREFFDANGEDLSAEEIGLCIQASVLDNVASPTANLNTAHEILGDRPSVYAALQQWMTDLMDDLLRDAAQRGLSDSFFVHYAPNLGRDARGHEIVWFSSGPESGTTDFQFMLRGAIKEAGVLAILNRYVYQRTGTYPLGPEFSAREAPKRHEELLQLMRDAFDPANLPLMVGVGDTVTSKAMDGDRGLEFRRGGSDRNFLQLIQDIGRKLNIGNVVAYVDSSQGEVKNRKPLKLETVDGNPAVLEGPGDSRDVDDPLTLNVVFPGGYQEYTSLFQAAAQRRGDRPL
jgi:glucosylglycerol 3-phosphatase